MPDISTGTANDTMTPSRSGFDLTKKMGPLPMWGWGLAVIVAIVVFIYVRKKKSGTGATPSISGGSASPTAADLGGNAPLQGSLTTPSGYGFSYSGPASGIPGFGGLINPFLPPPPPPPPPPAAIPPGLQGPPPTTQPTPPAAPSGPLWASGYSPGSVWGVADPTWEAGRGAWYMSVPDLYGLGKGAGVNELIAHLRAQYPGGPAFTPQQLADVNKGKLFYNPGDPLYIGSYTSGPGRL